MNRKLFITLLVSAFLLFFAYQAVQNVNPENYITETTWVPFEEAFTQAESENKYLLLDIYEIGCKFCRAMEREVYPSEPVVALMDRFYVPVRLDGRSTESITYLGEQMTLEEFASKMGVTAYPYTVVMRPDGSVVDSQRGYMDSFAFSRWLRSLIPT
jgi:thioredoxin-related protein